jgi:RNA polymerase sigma factor (sigma-70 family)
MMSCPLSRVVQSLHHLAHAQGGAGPTDGQLLERFLARQDEAAFAALVRRHGPMVLRVCQRVLGEGPDAEDAFQVTFLVLARKAAVVVPREAVGKFLYGVAHRTALKVRTTRARRHRHEKQVKDMPHPPVEVETPNLWTELRTLLDDEVQRLPDRYRVPVVLCDLEARSRKEVARQLGIPEGTLSSRLATARKRLAERLRRRALSLSNGVLPTALAPLPVARVPVLLTNRTVQTALLVAAGQVVSADVLSPRLVALLEGVLKTMSMTKPKLALVIVLAMAASFVGANLLRYQARADTPPQPVAERPEPDRPRAAAHASRPTPAQFVEAQVWALTGLDADKRTISAKLFRWIGEYAAIGKAFEVIEPDRRPLGIWKLEEFAVDRDAKILIDGKPGELTDLKPDMRLSLRLAPGKAAVVRIDATSPEDAILKAAEVEKNTITVTTGGKEVTLPLSPEAKLTRNGYATFQFTDLKPGMRLDLQLGVEGDRIVVRAIKAGY